MSKAITEEIKMKTLDKVIYIKNGSSFLYFFPKNGKNSYDKLNLNLSKKTEDKTRNGAVARAYIPPIALGGNLYQGFLSGWMLYEDIGKLLESKGYEVVNYSDEFNSLDDFFLFLIKERAKELGFLAIFKADEIAKLTNKISELRLEYATKKADFDKLDNEANKVKTAIEKLEAENNKLLEGETFNDKKFSANSLKIATLKRDNKTLLNNCDSLESEIKELESEIEELKKELKELESV